MVRVTLVLPDNRVSLDQAVDAGASSLGVRSQDRRALDLIAERIAIDTYTEMIRYVAQTDITTRRMLESILAVEEEHADDMASFLVDIEKDWKTRNRTTG